MQNCIVHDSGVLIGHAWSLVLVYLCGSARGFFWHSSCTVLFLPWLLASISMGACLIYRCLDLVWFISGFHVSSVLSQSFFNVFWWILRVWALDWMILDIEVIRRRKPVLTFWRGESGANVLASLSWSIFSKYFLQMKVRKNDSEEKSIWRANLFS